MRLYREILKHSSIYGLDQVLSRLASLLMLPVYTHFLPPAHYGVIAILDLVSGMLGILIGAGIVAAANRYHFDTNNESQQKRVWWSGLLFITFTATAIVIPALLARESIADFALGEEFEHGGLFFLLALMTLWFIYVGGLPAAYLKVRKWSKISVGLSLTRLLLNICLNLTFLVIFEMGITGILLGNLMTGAIMTLILCGILVANIRPFAIEVTVLRKMLAFGSPLILTSFLSLIMHQADRYLLRSFIDMDQVGIYSLAYQIGQGVNALYLVPFTTIWNAVLYEIAVKANYREMYADVFVYFTDGLALLMLATSLFASPFLSLLTSDNYAEAARIIPIICLAYYFFSLHEHFKVPVMLAKKTLSLVPVFSFAAIINIISNLVLIPLLGAAGAAWASVITFAAFSGFGLYLYRRIDRYPYPFARALSIVAGMVVTYLVIQSISDTITWWALGISTIAWLFWGIVLFRKNLNILVSWVNIQKVEE